MDPRLKKNELGYWEIVDKPTAADLREYYANKYYQESTSSSYTHSYSEEEKKYIGAKLGQRWRVIEKILQGPSRQLSTLDVGCGEGFALDFMIKKGCIVRGLDFSAAGVEQQNPDCKPFLKTGDLFELLQDELNQGNRYDVVWLQNVLEHVLDPVSLMESLRRLIAPNGVAVVTVPNDCSKTQQAALNHQHIETNFWIAPPDHLSYFDVDSLTALAKHCNWQCKEALGDFPIDWFLFHPGSNYIKNKNQGKPAHRARVQIENMINEQPLELAVQFWSAAAKVGVGRDLTLFLQAA